MDLKDLKTFKLNKVQMNNLIGGISREEYCLQIQQMACSSENSWWGEAEWDAWGDAYTEHCMGK